MSTILFGLNSEQWGEVLISVLMVFTAIVLGRWLIILLVDRGFRRLVRRSKTGLDDAIVNAFRTPLYLLLVVFVTEYALKRLEFLPVSWQPRMEDTFYILYLLTGFYFVGKLIHNLFIWYEQEMTARTESELDEQFMPFFRRIALVILGAIGLIMLLSHFNVDVSALVTTLGITSLAIALAAQDALSDTISGFTIMMDRPFRIGDRIQIQDLGTWGDVVDIGLRSSRVRTRDNRMVVVPNSVIGKSLVVNYAYPDTQYRIQIHIGIAYGSDIEKARQIMVETVQEVEGVLAEHPVEALFLEFGDSALMFRIRWWIESYEDTRRMFDRVNSALYHALNEAGIDIPFPQQVVYNKYEGDSEIQISA
jgi:small-conductance mechanosensitive channel